MRMPQKKYVATEILAFDFELFIGAWKKEKVHAPWILVESRVHRPDRHPAQHARSRSEKMAPRQT